jgi:hypothetical protein
VSETAEGPEPKTAIEQAVEHAFDLFVYAPIGLLFEGSSLLPELIAKGKGHVATARVMGQFAVDQAQKSATAATARLQDQAAGVLDFIGDSISPLPSEPTRPEEPAPTPPPSAPSTRAKVAAKATHAVNSAISVATLAIPDYDGLSASQVVNRLAGLSPVELENVQLYEAAHRGRKTILSKVAQLQGR